MFLSLTFVAELISYPSAPLLRKKRTFGAVLSVAYFGLVSSLFVFRRWLFDDVLSCLCTSDHVFRVQPARREHRNRIDFLALEQIGNFVASEYAEEAMASARSRTVANSNKFRVIGVIAAPKF